MKRTELDSRRDPSLVLLRGESPALRVLLAEDDPELRAMLASVLRRDGHGVTELCDGAQLASALAADSVGSQEVLVLADVRLPIIDSVTVLQAVRGRGLRPRVALMSAFADDVIREAARTLQALALFDKPFDLDVLRAFVRYRARWP